MSPVRIILWLLAAALFTVFAVANWVSVPMRFGTTEIGIKLPVLLLAALALGYLPGWARYRFARRRLEAHRLAAATPDLPPLKHPEAVSQAEPTIVPPGCG